MVIKCQSEAEAILLSYLQEEAVYNTFMTADIINYGFEQRFQEIYADVAGEVMEPDAVKGVYLKFYDNFMIYSRTKEVDREFLRSYFTDWLPAVVMGKADVIAAAAPLLPDYTYNEKSIFALSGQDIKRPPDIGVTVKRATLEDVDRIYQFLMSIEEIKHLYDSREMIVSRIKTGDGHHCFVEKEGVIIGHANSTAENPSTVMIGGVGTKAQARGRGIASAIVYELAHGILEQGKTPCLFGKKKETHNLFTGLGFRRFGAWATLERPYPDSVGRLL